MCCYMKHPLQYGRALSTVIHVCTIIQVLDIQSRIEKYVFKIIIFDNNMYNIKVCI